LLRSIPMHPFYGKVLQSMGKLCRSFFGLNRINLKK
jgi:hypothetical protein